MTQHCIYNPHGVECRAYADYKLIDSDSGMESYCCTMHKQGYFDYNERCGREVFIVTPAPMLEFWRAVLTLDLLAAELLTN